MKVIKQIDKKTRLIQFGKKPDVKIGLQRKKWYGYDLINWVGTARFDTIDEFEDALLADERSRKKPFYGRIINDEKF